ncbi:MULTISPECIES: hypothetical protein [unclassified Sphingobium]|uniref:hypothetical protein n=1 Tax=unclassified Sphingobium TaxID=2611147 RepID=UPI0035A739A7
MQGDPVGAAALGEQRVGMTGWEGPWGPGVRPGAAMRPRAEVRTERPAEDRGDRVR